LASSMLCVVSGQTVVHSESSNDSMTTLPRNWLSDIGWPNWFVSRKSGAGSDPSEEPRSRLGLYIPAAFAAAVGELAAAPEPEAVLQPTAPASTPSTATAQSATRARKLVIGKLVIGKKAYCGSSPTITAAPWPQNRYRYVRLISAATRLRPPSR